MFDIVHAMIFGEQLKLYLKSLSLSQMKNALGDITQVVV